MARQLRCEDYTVGWVCALPIELAAAQEMLDEEHITSEHNNAHDTNIYTCGTIGKHNVVITCLPGGQIGTNSAAAVANQMKSTFTSTRFGLMVGIGGGVPSEADIRLGDIVVSQPHKVHGGVVQYDSGKTTPGGFQRTGSLNSPPGILLSAVSKVQAQHKRRKGQLSEYVFELARLLPEYGREAAGPDTLFEAGYNHELGETTCEKCDRDRLLVRKTQRQEPVVHYGTIASGNQVMRDAAQRDKVSADLGGVLCFEMEAAGLMNSFPCLVIRGICDYADSHKNKQWQDYAAGTAAAYAKELLSVIPSSRVQTEKRIVDVMSDLQETAEKRQLIAEEHLDTAQKRFKTEDAERKREREEKCLHLFRLTESSKDVTYEWYKDRVEERVEGTCMWFLHHAHFLEWIKQDSGPLLVSADPGCGKSVLAKYLVDHVLPGSATVCYYFFKDQDQNTVRQALCALLHQLISKKPALIQHAMKQYEKDGESLTKSTNSLWTILQDAVQDPHAGSVIVVLDALDECLESEFENLMCNIESQLRNCQSSHSRLRYLMTSRPYEQIVDRFWRLLESFPRIHIPGEEEHEAISQEVNHVIEHRVNQLAYRKKLTDKLKENLTCNLTKTKHRTYLWVYLVFDHLETEGFKKTPNGIEEATRSLPRSVNEAYKQILAKSREQVTVRRALAIILAANRPFTLSELNLALEIKETTKSIQNDEIEQEEDFKPRLRSLCGLFVSVHHGKVYFLHQTAREFLLADPPHSTSIPQGLQWQHSITMQDAHKVLAECCVRYLSFLDSDASLLADVTDKRSPCTPRAALFKYSAKFWPFHFQDSCFSSNEDADISRLASTICDPNSRSFSAWSKKHGHLIPFWNEERPSQLTIASCFGHNTVVQLLLNEYADVNAQGGWYGNALQAASAKGHEQVVRMLLNQGANVNAKHGYYGSALQAASLEGYEQIVKMLLNEGANDNAQGGGYGNALRAASSRGYEQIVKMLLNEGANVNTQSGDYGNALQAASLAGYEQIVKILLNEGANVNAQGGAFSNALQAASVGGHEQVVEILINRGADVNAQGRNYGNALQAASKEGHEQVVKMLLDKGVNVNAQGRDYCTALQIASENGYEQVVKMLLDKGADVNVCTQGELHSIALYAASQSGYKHVVEMLLNEGANVNAQGGDYGNALQAASAEGYKQVVEILLDRGADVNAQGGLEYSNALQVASAKGHEEVVELLLDRGADVNAQGGYKYSSALEAASANDREDIVELLLEHGARWYDEDASPPSSPYP